jgi:enhancer of mRNA-decapping protein 4
VESETDYRESTLGPCCSYSKRKSILRKRNSSGSITTFIMSDEEPFGTTPLPTESDGGSLEVTLDLWSRSAKVAQQPQTQQIAVYEPKLDDECINGGLLDVNQHFVVYAVKNGLIRVLHRHSSLKALLRGHQGELVTDISFFLDGDVLATVGHANGISKVIVWRVFEQSPEVQSEKLLEISSTEVQMNRLLWHPFNPNQLWVLHGKKNEQLATLVETTRIQTTPHPDEKHPVCKWYSKEVLMEGAVQLSVPGGSLEDLAWSGRDTRHMLTVHSNGLIILWDLKQTEDSSVNGVSISVPKKVAVLVDSAETPLSRCLFLPHENAVRLEGQTDTLTSCFVTGSHQNKVITLWSSFANSGLPIKLQVLKLAEPSPSYVLDVCFGPAPLEASPPSCFILWADRHKGQLLAIHVASQWNAQNKALCVGGDYVVPFSLHYPIFSWSVVCAPTQDISDDEIAEHEGLIFDMKLFSYQSKAVQCLTLTSYMCLPPEHAYQQSSPGLTVKKIEGPPAASGIGNSEPEYDEEYDLEDVDDEEDDEEEEENFAIESNILPVPPPSIGPSQNAFANWLGAIAGNTTTPNPPPPPTSLPPLNVTTPPPGLAPVGATTVSAASFFNPLDLLTSGSSEVPPPSDTSTSKGREPTLNKQNGGNKRTSNNKTRSKSPKGKNRNKNETTTPFPDGAKISILKRDETVPVAAAAAVTVRSSPVPPPSDPAIIDPATIDSAILSSFFPPPMHGPVSDPWTEATISRVIAQELAKQPSVGAVVEEALASKLIPAMNKVLQESLASFGRPLQTSMDRLGQQGVRVDQKDLQAALNLETPIKAALADTVRNVFIPAMESVASQVLQKVTPPPSDGPDKEMMAMLETLTKQISAMNTKMDAMASEIRILKSFGAPNPPMPPPPPPQQLPQPNQLEAARNEIGTLLMQKQFQTAFTKAVSTSNAEMALWACSRANVQEVLGGNSPQLSQTILLCLMQQLGAAMATTTSQEALTIELQWLQEIALTLDPGDTAIQRHVPTVLQQLVGSINQKITEGNPHLRRPLQMLLQVIRGMQMG